ncbi:proline-rich protein 2-like [Dama dama]|uniref:proline-rich protein 2-like n=1 Tax=Dama dama TaxID=30532 RepID=UPI002A368825|nr:proline-rich protein 2-like [Dama dama]
MENIFPYKNLYANIHKSQEVEITINKGMGKPSVRPPHPSPAPAPRAGGRKRAPRAGSGARGWLRHIWGLPSVRPGGPNEETRETSGPTAPSAPPGESLPSRPQRSPLSRKLPSGLRRAGVAEETQPPEAAAEGAVQRPASPPGGAQQRPLEVTQLTRGRARDPTPEPLAPFPAASPGSPRFALGESPLHTPLRQCRAAAAGYLLEVAGALASPPAGTLIRVTSLGRAPRPRPRPLKTAPPSLQVRPAPSGPPHPTGGARRQRGMGRGRPSLHLSALGLRPRLLLSPLPAQFSDAPSGRI